MVAIRCKFTLIWFVALLPVVIISAQEAHATQKVFLMLPASNTLDGWKLRGPKFMSKWIVGAAMVDPKSPKKLAVAQSDSGAIELANRKKGSVDIYTEQVFGDCIVELEVMIPEGSNSGIYLMGRYEVQVVDSYGKPELKNSGMGAIFGTAAPRINAAKKPGEWQTFLIEFKAPQFKNRKRVKPAEFVKVKLNGELIHENVKLEKGPTSGALDKKETDQGPLLFQGGMGAVAYRNIRISIPGK